MTAPELAVRFEVSLHTINRNIEDICQAYIPLVTIPSYGGGMSIAEGFRLDKALLTSDELQALLSGIKGLDIVWDTAHFPTLAEKLSDMEPYKLIFRWSVWHVRSWCLEREAFRLFKLNRIWDLEPGTEDLSENSAYAFRYIWCSWLLQWLLS